ncbi:uncharacterized protein LOC100368314 [Saccoglossus kowalevskii]|uniref:CRAL-TRIO domain-containing protein C3H8.02-like n=1 Tax=Saccoglossus kowalevskii TaxID=10224 RepID=A0ABM0GJZ2_SACKO|nr:PREDICTED: CRAL-TRIO domain-containing protein C3H8.02-like [Saccoglossus kowalevskii]
MTEINEEDFKELKSRLQLIFDADPDQFHSDSSLKRFLRAFITVDSAFTSVLKCNKWRREFGVESLTSDNEEIQTQLATGVGKILPHRDIEGRPIVLITGKLHNAYERDVDVLTRFTVYLLETASKKCNEDVIDNLCVIFDLRDFGMANMDYQFVKNLIWLLTKYYPERLGVCLIINAPVMFWGCWQVIRPWLHDFTASKVVFINGAEHLSQFLCPDILPKDVIVSTVANNEEQQQ